MEQVIAVGEGLQASERPVARAAGQFGGRLDLRSKSLAQHRQPNAAAGVNIRLEPRKACCQGEDPIRMRSQLGQHRGPMDAFQDQPWSAVPVDPPEQTWCRSASRDGRSSCVLLRVDEMDRRPVEEELDHSAIFVAGDNLRRTPDPQNVTHRSDRTGGL